MPILSDRVARIKRKAKREKYYLLRIGRNPYCPALPLGNDLKKNTKSINHHFGQKHETENHKFPRRRHPALLVGR